VHRGTVTQLPRPGLEIGKAKASVLRPRSEPPRPRPPFSGLKARQNIVIFPFFKIAAGGHLGFLNSGNLNSWNVQRAKMLMYLLNFVKIGQTIAS